MDNPTVSIDFKRGRIVARCRCNAWKIEFDTQQGTRASEVLEQIDKAYEDHRHECSLKGAS
jgi:hypothetical protein